MLKPNTNILINLTVLIFCLVVAYIASSHTPFSFDSFWLLRMGDDFLQGLNPLIDSYSFTHSGQNVNSPYLIMPILLSALVSEVGVIKGFHIYIYSSFFLFLILTTIYLNFKKTPWFIFIIILPLILFFLEFRPTARPELLSYSLIVVCLYLYDRAQIEFNHKNLLFISILLLLWVNYHTPIMGCIIIAGLFLEKAITKITDKDKNFSWLMWFSWGIVVFSIGFLNIKMEHFIFSVLSLSTNNWKELITEYHPSYAVYLNRPYMQILWVANIGICLYLIFKKQYGYFFICTLLLINGFVTIRLVPFSFIINLIIFSVVLGEAEFIQLFYRKKILNKVYLLTLWFSCVVFAVLFSVSQAYTYGGKNLSLEKMSKVNYPVDEIEYLKGRDIVDGKILNELQTGGYLIYNLSPKYKVYIDGRTNILYPFPFVKRSMNILVSSNLLKKETEKYKIDYALFELNESKYISLYNTGLYNLDYISKNFMLLSTRKSNFPKSGNIMFQPACMASVEPGELKEEISKARQILQKDSLLLPVINVLDDFVNNNIGEIRSISESKLTMSDYTIRVAGYAAVYKHDYVTSAVLFSKIRDKNVVDLMMMSYSFYYLNRFSASEEVLKSVLSVGKSKNFHTYENIMFYSIASALNDKQHLGDEVKNRMSQLKYTNNMEVIQMSLLPLMSCYPPGIHN